MALVLIVDDSPTEVHVIRTYLENNGFETDAAGDGDEGLQKARHLKPDLVIMDIVMPGMNGYQATREMARDPETADIPVLMVTTKGNETDRIWGLRQGASQYLVKPVNDKQLVEAVEAALESD